MVDEATNQYYLVPYDIRELGRLRADAIKAETLTAEISDIRAKRLLAILDCCHSAGMEVKAVEADDLTAVAATAFPLDMPETKGIPAYDLGPGSKNVSDLREGEGRAILNSSTGAQSSYVRKDGRMSLFTYHLIEALTGHAPHPDDATVVYVTDVMSWVTHQVKKSAAAQGRDQTPVMKTSGVFPVAQLIGGQGVAKGIGQLPPDPLVSLPPLKVVKKKEVDKSRKVGAQVKGDAGGNVAGRDINIKEGGVRFKGKMSGGNIVGRDLHVVQQGSSDKEELAALFTPLLQEVRQQNEAAAAQVKELQAEVARGEQADDEKMSDLIVDIAEAAPAVVETLVGIFTNSIVARVAGVGAKATLRAIQRLR
jgi:hypothetical protein